MQEITLKKNSKGFQELAVYSPVELAAQIAPLEIQKQLLSNSISSNKAAFNSNTIKLSEITKTHSKELSYFIIEAYVLDLSNYTGVQNKISKEQIEQLSMFIYQDAYSLNIYELALFFSRVKKDYYKDANGNTFYGSVDPIKIMGFMTKFLNERQDAIELINKEQIELEKRKTFEECMSINMTDEQKKEIETIKTNFIKKIGLTNGGFEIHKHHKHVETNDNFGNKYCQICKKILK